MRSFCQDTLALALIQINVIVYPKFSVESHASESDLSFMIGMLYMNYDPLRLLISAVSSSDKLHLQDIA